MLFQRTGLGASSAVGCRVLAHTGSTKTQPHNDGRPDGTEVERRAVWAALSAFQDQAHRSNGEFFPDPTSEGIRIPVRKGMPSDLAPDNPRFQAAEKACQSLQPGQPSGPTDVVKS